MPFGGCEWPFISAALAVCDGGGAFLLTLWPWSGPVPACEKCETAAHVQTVQNAFSAIFEHYADIESQ
jgi:hypothetical protein